MGNYIHLRCVSHDPYLTSGVLTKEAYLADIVDMLKNRHDLVKLNEALSRVESASVSFATEAQHQVFRFIREHPHCNIEAWTETKKVAQFLAMSQTQGDMK